MATATGCTIRPPTTMGDNAKPSDSILRDSHRVLALLEDERILAASALLDNVKNRIQERESKRKKSSARRLKKMASFGSSSNLLQDEEYRTANELLESNQSKLDILSVCVLCIVY